MYLCLLCISAYLRFPNFNIYLILWNTASPDPNLEKKKWKESGFKVVYLDSLLGIVWSPGFDTYASQLDIPCLGTPVTVRPLAITHQIPDLQLWILITSSSWCQIKFILPIDSVIASFCLSHACISALCLYFASFNKYLRTVHWPAKPCVWNWGLNSEPDEVSTQTVCFVTRRQVKELMTSLLITSFIKFCGEKAWAEVDPDLGEEPEVHTICRYFFENKNDLKIKKRKSGTGPWK